MTLQPLSSADMEQIRLWRNAGRTEGDTMKVWTVWEGHYSDRRLNGIFSSKRKAQEYLYRHKGKKAWFRYTDYIDDEPIEYEVDNPRDVWQAEVTIYKNGKDPTVDDIGEPYDDEDLEEITETNNSFWVLVHFHPDKEIMIKAARDKLAQYKAQKAGL